MKQVGGASTVCVVWYRFLDTIFQVDIIFAVPGMYIYICMHLVCDILVVMANF